MMSVILSTGRLGNIYRSFYTSGTMTNVDFVSKIKEKVVPGVNLNI